MELLSTLPPAARLSVAPPVMLCAHCGAELPLGASCIDCEDDADVASEPVPEAIEALVYPGSRWTTRGLLLRAVVVVDVHAGRALVRDERNGEQWREPVLEITRSWTARAISGRWPAVRS